MVRRGIIILLAFATAATTTLFLVSFAEVVRWKCHRSQRRHVCIELRDGNVFLHYMYSDYEPFLDTIDEHEVGYQRWLGHYVVSHAESEHPWNPEEGESPTPMVTYAWSHRVGWPLAIFIVVLGAYPAIAFSRGPLRRWHRRRLGRCLKCGYDLSGNVSGVCPECGTPVSGGVPPTLE